ncbi:uncharacterized protein LOC131937758 isoform X2 [Physella acuta]|uniref:uncharacterized protein LOC131937758 isoform X2 n=1 Tax=Physella acuta TaxID=109671 RepID=UPI0027DD61D8|nr:uncharacterized protein LOC131937758 isoform X2 [Physella acuta]
MAVAGCVSFLMLAVVVAIIGLSFYWGPMFNQWMKQKGFVRMPKNYFKKKEEAKKRLVGDSRPSSMINGQLPAQNFDRDDGVILQPGVRMNSKSTGSRTSWVNGWNQRQSAFVNKIYEEKDVTLELGPEGEEEFKIEAELVDNEHLDIGPFKRQNTDTPIPGNVYNEPYIYSTVNSSLKTKKKPATNGDIGSSTQGVTTAIVSSEMTELAEETSGGSHKNINYEDVLVRL